MKNLEIQGDVALRVAVLPEGAKKINNRPLALGETSGHAHCVETLKPQAEMTNAFDLFEFEGKTFVAVGGDGATLRHIRLKTGEQADHAPLILAQNTVYEVILQNEYNPEAGAFQRVLD
jgi:hypothetical protein